jgi:fucose permease
MFAAIAGASVSPSLMGIVMQRAGTEVLVWLLMVPAVVTLIVHALAAKQKIAEHIEIH